MYPYSAKVIVASVYPGCSDLMSKQMEMDNDDYIIVLVMSLGKGGVF